MNILIEELRKKQEKERAAQRGQYRNQQPRPNPNMQRNPIQQQSYQNFNNINFAHQQRSNNQSYNQGYGNPGNRQQNFNYNEPNQGQFSNYTMPNNANQFRHASNPNQSRGRGGFRGHFQPYGQQAIRLQNRRLGPQDFIPPKHQQNQRAGYYNQNQQMQQGENNYKYRNPNYNQRYSQQQNNQRNNFQSQPRNISPPPPPAYNQPNQYRQSSGFSPQRGNNNYRGNNFRGRYPFNSSRGGSRENQFRGRGRSNRPNQDQIVDSRPMTQDQSQQRMRKFVNLNQDKYVSNQPRTQQQQRRGRGGRARGRGQQRTNSNDYKKAPRKSQESEQQKSETPIQSEQEFSESEEQEQEQAGSSKMQVEGEEEYQDESNEDQADQQQSQRQQIFEEDQEQYSRSESAEKSSSRKGKGGEAEKMCSEKQFNNRMNIFLENNMSNIERTRDSGLKVINTNLNVDISKSFSIFQINKRTNLPDEQLAMKKFQRSANRADDQDDRENDAVYVPRNTKGLIITMNHIKKQILDCDSKKASQLAFPIPHGQKKIQFIQIYGVLWDRMREMIKDITRLDEESKHEKQIITICEEITRFFILSINQGRKKYGHALTFDDKMNKESLTKVMTPLLGLYADSKLKLKKLIKEMEEGEEGEEGITVEKITEQMVKKGIYISPNQPEMTAYAILFSQDYRKYLYENIFIGFELSESNPLYESKQIQQVLNIKSALSSKNYSKYFDMLQSQDYDYLISNLMVLNVQGIRKQISQLLQHSLKYYDEGKTKKGVKEQYFKKMLHFGDDQDKQYKQFLRTIKAVVSKNTGYVNWDDSMPDDQKIYKIPPFPIDFKLQRMYFQGQDAKGMMKRSQIVERSWKKSDYVEQLICGFLNQDYVPNISPIRHLQKQTSQKQKNKENPIQPQQQKQNQTTTSSQNKNGSSSAITINKSNDLLAAKKQELERRKFLDKLSSKMEQLIKPDKTKQQDRAKSLTDMFNCLIRVQEEWKFVGFRAIQCCYQEQVFKEIYMLKFHQYITMKNHFIKAFNTTSPQPNPSPLTPTGISNLLLPQPQPISQLLKPELNLIKILKNSSIKQFRIKIFTDILKTDPNYTLIDQVIKNIFCLLIPQQSILQTTCNDCYQYVDDGHVVSVMVEGVDGREGWRKFLGADCVVFLQTKPEIKEFSIILTQFKHFQNCVKTSPFFNLPISVIRLIDSMRRNTFQTLNIKVNFQCSQYLRPCTLQLSPALSLGLSKVFQQSAACYRKRPNLQVKSFGHILSTICINMQYVGEAARQGCGIKQMFLYHQEYINMCIQQILRLSKTYYLSAGLFGNWIEVLMAVEGQQISTKLDNIQMLMQTQYRQLENFAFAFVFNSPMEEAQNKIVFEKHDFVSHYFKFCRKFDQQGQVTEQLIQNYVDLLKINQGQITGQIYKFYKQILSLLSSLVTNFNIVVPKQFRFYLNPDNLHKQVGDKISKIKQKCKRQQQKLAKVQAYKSLSSLIFEPIVVSSMDAQQKQEQKQKDYSKQKQSYRMLNRNKRQIRNEFKYEKAQWLADVKKKIKII